MKLHPYLVPDTKINSKWIKDLNIKAKTIKFFTENINLHDLGFGSGFLNITPKTQATKEKDKLDFIKF